jgi:hypothetical protein
MKKVKSADLVKHEMWALWAGFLGIHAPGADAKTKNKWLVLTSID